MPEGDTILRAARKLALHLEGRVLAGGTSPALAGRTVRRVEACGKHLLVHFDDGRCLRTHLRMRGSWHVYARGEAWGRPRHQARVVLATDDAVCVCFAAPTVELTSAAPVLDLGPDILAAEFDSTEAVRRLRARPDEAIGVALLVQRAVCGIGNIYKSEALFLERVNPFARVGDLGDDRLHAILARARTLMRRNLAPAAFRRTTAAASLGSVCFHVYRRSGHACPRCGERIAMRRQGSRELLRSTYYCPTCQG